MSLFGELAWTLMFALFSIVGFADGLQYTPIANNGFWMILPSFVLIMLASWHDSSHSKEKPTNPTKENTTSKRGDL